MKVRGALGLISVLVFVLSAGFAAGATLKENGLDSLGYSDFIVSGADRNVCTEYAFIKPADLNRMAYPVLSIHAQFSPVESAGADISVYLNNDENAVAVVRADKFTNGWARFDLPWELLEEKNTAKVCARTSYTTTEIKVLKDSLLGYYFKPDFGRVGAFTKMIVPKTPKPGQEFEVRVRLFNYGSEGAKAELKYVRNALEDRLPELMFVKGDTGFSGEIGPCVTRSEDANCIVPAEAGFGYLVRAKKPQQMTLLPAILRYENVFGETVERESNRQTITVVQPEIRVRAFLLVDGDAQKAGAASKATLGVKNEGIDTLYNISAVVLPQQGLQVEGNGRAAISSIAPGETKYTDFSLTAGQAGNYGLGCRLGYLDYNAVETECSTANVIYEAVGIDPALIGAGVLLLVAIGVYAYFVRKKE
ncbi:MAG: hypothetical protein V1676_05440 [Candidatus Diapherotrites archaeon]